MNTFIDPRTVLSYSLNKATPQERKERDLQSLRESSREFETLLVMEAYKAMRKSVPDGGLIKKSMAIETFQEMFDMEMAKQTTQGKGIGVADMMYKQMAHLIENKKYDE
ncbi:rod-binding protein [Desulfosediminicola flagellatus]|uniref:rod-binding protein n=1 Tax=Desulfosediminicola flagellatus TaxID=2569541 RepID=UPI0010AB97BE|nr:rod-binding protein [Desulfosediminicola flagellatus]